MTVTPTPLTPTCPDWYEFLAILSTVLLSGGVDAYSQTTPEADVEIGEAEKAFLEVPVYRYYRHGVFASLRLPGKDDAGRAVEDAKSWTFRRALSSGCRGLAAGRMASHETSRAILGGHFQELGRASFEKFDMDASLAFLVIHDGGCDCEVVVNLMWCKCEGPPKGCLFCRGRLRAYRRYRAAEGRVNMCPPAMHAYFSGLTDLPA
jgi:hypothetical protein